MANILFMDGFDQYVTFENMPSALWDESSGLSAPSGISTAVLPYGRGSSFARNNDDYDWAYKWDWGVESTTVVVNFNMLVNYDGWNNDCLLTLVNSVGFGNVSIFGGGAYHIRVSRGLLGDEEEEFGRVSIKNNRWYHYELKVYFHESAGTVELRVNGETVIDETGLDTVRDDAAGAVANCTGITLNRGNLIYVDNLVVHDGTVDTPRTDADGFLGPIEIITLFPNGDATPNDWTRSSGTNGWEIADIASPSLYGDTEPYMYTNTATDTEKFNLTNLPARDGTAGAWQIKGIMGMARVGLETPGLASLKYTIGTQVQTGINVGAGANKWINTPVFEYSTGTTDWTESDVNNLTIQLELE